MTDKQRKKKLEDQKVIIAAQKAEILDLKRKMTMLKTQISLLKGEPD